MAEVTRESNHLQGQRSSLASPRNRFLGGKAPAGAAPLPEPLVPGPGEKVCVECGRIDGPRGHDCLAHPKHLGMRTLVAVFFFGPLILVPILGWDALLGFAPWFLFAWWVKSR